MRSQERSPFPEAIAGHYASGYEAKPPLSHAGKLDAVRTRGILERYLPPPPATVRDIGGGPGAHAWWLAARGYEVHLLDSAETASCAPEIWGDKPGTRDGKSPMLARHL